MKLVKLIKMCSPFITWLLSHICRGRYVNFNLEDLNSNVISAEKVLISLDNIYDKCVKEKHCQIL
jgi:hypothetical protein